MFITSINNTLIPNLLTSVRFRIFRHALLLFIIWIISFSINVGGEYKFEYYQYFERVIIFLIFATVVYFNMKVLVPRFLLQNKLSSYFTYLLACVFAILLLISLSQFAFHAIDWDQDRNYIGLFFSFTNAILAFGFIIICSSTFVIAKNWIIYNQRIRELESITLEAELQQLKNQINPHFLFNMLNNANIMVKREPRIAAEMLTKLDDLLSYQIEDSTKEKVLLNDDITFLTDYLELERSRRDRFKYTISIDGNIKDIQIPPLLFIPFVENAVKHSAESKNMSYINITFKMRDTQLIFLCINSKPKYPLKQTESGGLGLVNIRRRLELLYKDDYFLELSETDTTYTVNLELKL